MLEIFLISWILCGIFGYVLRLIPKQTRPAKFYLILIVLLPHLIFGYASLFYGYVCYSNAERSKL